MSPEELIATIHAGEQDEWEFKTALGFLGTARLDLAKDLIAMANTPGGGHLLVGVGKGEAIEPVTEGMIDSWGPTRVMGFLESRCSPTPRVSREVVALPTGRIVVVSVEEFADVPVIVTKDIAPPTGGEVHPGGAADTREQVHPPSAERVRNEGRLDTGIYAQWRKSRLG